MKTSHSEPAGAGRVGERLRVVAGAAGDDARGSVRAVLRRDPVDLRQRAAQLERTGPLQVLGLESTVPPHSSERLRDVSTGVWRTRSRVRARASRTASTPSQPSSAGIALP